MENRWLTKSSTDCARSAQCAGYKHHFDECVERVTAEADDADYKGPKEDCVEECTFSPNSRGCGRGRSQDRY